MDYKERREKAFIKLTQLMEEYKDKVYYNNSSIKDTLPNDFYRAVFVDYLKYINHPFVQELEEVGLIEFYDNVLHFMRSNYKDNQST